MGPGVSLAAPGCSGGSWSPQGSEGTPASNPTQPQTDPGSATQLFHETWLRQSCVGPGPSLGSSGWSWLLLGRFWTAPGLPWPPTQPRQPRPPSSAGPKMMHQLGGTNPWSAQAQKFSECPGWFPRLRNTLGNPAMSCRSKLSKKSFLNEAKTSQKCASCWSLFGLGAIGRYPSSFPFPNYSSSIP